MNSSRHESGTSMLEMLLVLPTLVLMIFSMIEFAVLTSRWMVISNAAQRQHFAHNSLVWSLVMGANYHFFPYGALIFCITTVNR